MTLVSAAVEVTAKLEVVTAPPELATIASVSAPADFYDVELRAHHQHLQAAYGISRGDEVLDIGCGTGLTTREAARAAAPGPSSASTCPSERSSGPVR